MRQVNLAEHKQQHEELHANLDLLVADYLRVNGEQTLALTSVQQLLDWSHQQTLEPSLPPGFEHTSGRTTNHPRPEGWIRLPAGELADKGDLMNSLGNAEPYNETLGDNQGFQPVNSPRYVLANDTLAYYRKVS